MLDVGSRSERWWVVGGEWAAPVDVELDSVRRHHVPPTPAQGRHGACTRRERHSHPSAHASSSAVINIQPPPPAPPPVPTLHPLSHTAISPSSPENLGPSFSRCRPNSAADAPPARTQADHTHRQSEPQNSTNTGPYPPTLSLTPPRQPSRGIAALTHDEERGEDPSDLPQQPADHHAPSTYVSRNLQAVNSDGGGGIDRPSGRSQPRTALSPQQGSSCGRWCCAWGRSW